MSIFNHMGKLVAIDGEWATYEYYPNYISDTSEYGTFKVKPSSLLEERETEYEIINRPTSGKNNRPDEHVIFALISKIKVSAKAGNLFPEQIFHNA